jgi:hypothetical protein
MSGEPVDNEQSSEADTFCECDAVDDPTKGLRQGDVFEWNDPAADPWRRFGIIVTADCDIAHEKNAGVLSYVPLLAVTDYLSAFYLPKQISKSLVKIDERLTTTIQRLQTSNRPEFPSLLTSEVVISWIDGASIDAVADELRAPTEDREQLQKLVALRRELVGSLLSAEIAKHTEAICNARSILQQSKPDTVRTNLHKDVQSHLKDLPGDALFIRALSKIHSTGFIAYLRFVRELNQTAVAIRPADLSRGAQARRVGRLRAPYVYRLTQMLGTVFSSIGLPQEYEAARHEIIARLQRDGHLGKST